MLLHYSSSDCFFSRASNKIDLNLKYIEKKASVYTISSGESR